MGSHARKHQAPTRPPTRVWHRAGVVGAVLLLATALPLAGSAGASPPLRTATAVYGQPDFTSDAGNARGRGVAVDSAGTVYVAETVNHRVLAYPAGSTTATTVYGQPDLTSTTANNGGISASSLNAPFGVAVDDDGTVYIADTLNNRVLAYPAGTTTATAVYGQPDFVSDAANNGGVSANSLRGPSGVALDDDGTVYIADSFNSRVLAYPAGTTTATTVYGQFDLTGTTSNDGGVSATSLDNPDGVGVDTGTVYIADTGNNRVLAYPAGTTTATTVYGQPDFGSNLANNGGVSASSLFLPEGVAAGEDGTVYIADTNNNRILAYPAGTTTATTVYGQPDLGSNAADNGGTSSVSLREPRGLSVDSLGTVFIADTGNNRVLAYGSGSSTGLTARVELVATPPVCVVLDKRLVDFGELALGDVGSGGETTVTNCGERNVGLTGEVSQALRDGAPIWSPTTAGTDVCDIATNTFAYSLSGTLIGEDPISLGGLILGPGGGRVDTHTLAVPCPGSEGIATDLVTMNVLYTATLSP